MSTPLDPETKANLKKRGRPRGLKNGTLAVANVPVLTPEQQDMQLKVIQAQAHLAARMHTLVVFGQEPAVQDGDDVAIQTLVELRKRYDSVLDIDGDDPDFLLKKEALALKAVEVIGDMSIKLMKLTHASGSEYASTLMQMSLLAQRAKEHTEKLSVLKSKLQVDDDLTDAQLEGILNESDRSGESETSSEADAGGTETE